jgi:peptide-methionine (S)-S-oxide reductase
VGLGLIGILGACAGEDRLGVNEMPSSRESEDSESQAAESLATFGGGCFWCTEAIYQELDGVLSVTSGYAGGAVEDPTYAQVTSGGTGHAEVIQVRFDPEKISYETLLEVHFDTHDPTTLNRQGPDRGTQYRSIVLYHDDAQREAAERVMGAVRASGTYADPLVTELVPFDRFYPAEKYHQDYYAQNASVPYCRVMISPKLEKLRKRHAEKLR